MDLTDPQTKTLEHLAGVEYELESKLPRIVYGNARRSASMGKTLEALRERGLVRLVPNVKSPVFGIRRTAWSLTRKGYELLFPTSRFIDSGDGLIVRYPGEPICEICHSSVGAHEIPVFNARCERLKSERPDEEYMPRSWEKRESLRNLREDDER